MWYLIVEALDLPKFKFQFQPLLLWEADCLDSLPRLSCLENGRVMALALQGYW